MNLLTLTFKFLKRHKAILALMGFISSLCLCLTISLLGSYNSLEKTFNSYVTDYNHPDLQITTTNLTSDNLNDINTYIADYYDGEVSFDAVSITKCNALKGNEYYSTMLFSYTENDNLKFYFFEKSDEIYTNQVYIDAQFASNNKLSVGDYLLLNIEDKKINSYIGGIISAPDIILTGSDDAYFGVNPSSGNIYMVASDLFKIITPHYNYFRFYFADEKIGKQIMGYASYLLGDGYLDGYLYEDSPTAKEINDNLTVLKTLAYTIPIFFYSIMFIVLALLLSRLVKSSAQEIGILRSLGFSSFKVFIPILLALLIAITIFSMLGFIGGRLLLDFVYRVHIDTLYMPNYPTTLNLKSIALGILITYGVAILSSLISFISVIIISPASVMNGGGVTYKKALSFKNKKLNPLAKYHLMASFRAPLRLGLAIFSFIATTMLILASLSFNLSKDKLLDDTFFKAINYDGLVICEGEINDSIADIEEISYYEEVKTNSLIVNYNDNEVSINLWGISKDSSLINLYKNYKNKEINKPTYGIILESHAAKSLGVNIGDTITYKDNEIVVENICYQGVDYTSYVSLETFNDLVSNYELIYLFKGNNKNIINKTLYENSNVYSVVYIESLYANTNKVFKIYSIGVILIIIFAFIIGFLLLYETTINNLNEKERDFSLLKSLGTSDSEISISFFKNTLMQLILALLIGLPLGTLFASYVIKSLCTENREYPYVFSIYIYLITIIIVILFAILSHLLAFRKIKTWNLANKLKEKD